MKFSLKRFENFKIRKRLDFSGIQYTLYIIQYHQGIQYPETHVEYIAVFLSSKTTVLDPIVEAVLT